jgi:hypothetical protein
MLWGLSPGRGWEFVSFTTVSRPPLGPTLFPIQWLPGALSLGVNRAGREADHSPPSICEVKECVEQYLHSPLRLHGAERSSQKKKHKENSAFTVY